MTLKQKTHNPASARRVPRKLARRFTPAPGSMEDKVASAPPRAPRPTLTAEEAVRQSRQKIVDALPGMTEALIAHAENGAQQSAKFLVDFAGLSAAGSGSGPQPLSPVIALLMKELGLGMPDP